MITRSKVFVPRDTTACSLGADKVAAALQRHFRVNDIAVDVVRNGSRGLYWLEPLIEIETDKGRQAFGPVYPHDLEEFIGARCWEGNTDFSKHLGLTEEIPFLQKQTRVTFARVGVIDPLSISEYKQHAGFAGLEKALAMSSQDIVSELKQSGLRGRGGAAFPAGIKWQTVLDSESAQKYIVCNADEGDSGTYSDRMLMESDPFCLIEGMLIAGLAVNADQGFIYLRDEYPLAHNVLTEALVRAREGNYLGNNIQGSDKSFDIEIRLGAGAYICGEETSMLESLEGKRGEVRPKPPLPAVKGLFGKPTVINNVISLASVPTIINQGAACYESYGVNSSRGTLPFQLSGNIKQTGLVELPFGASLRDLLYDFGEGSRSGKPLRAVQVGGPLGAYLPESQWNTPLDYEAFSAIGAMLGHGGIVAFDESVDMREQARFSMEFCALESCGKCTPCRIGSVRGVEVIDRIKNGENTDENKELLKELCATMVAGSLCAMGGLTPYPVLSALEHFAEDFEQGK
ncbi:MAG: formate dehydrogenase [Gammaproteobacteria bacterium]|nr:formate dehydrogenase [Gammaproteobacteria bacterium]MDD9894374.1 formate dehydrogenase [Gammaproteobacteria bacterium]MDD9958373.1 formate dehydrogenase [Gammaproteobacteria bacterium]